MSEGRAKAKTLSEMPHRFMDKLQPESANSYLSRLLKWCFQNKLDLPKQWVSEAYFKAEREKDTELMSQATQRIIAFRKLTIEKDNKIKALNEILNDNVDVIEDFHEIILTQDKWIDRLEIENKKLESEIEQLKTVRDALGQSNKNALADRNVCIKKAEAFEAENKELQKERDDFEEISVSFWDDTCELEVRLEVIRQHYQKRPIPQNCIAVNDWLVELGVLLKGLDQKTEDNKK